MDVFIEWDADGDRKVSMAEFRKGITVLGIEATDKTCYSLFDIFDHDDDGFLDYAELRQVLECRVERPPEPAPVAESCTSLQPSSRPQQLAAGRDTAAATPARHRSVGATPSASRHTGRRVSLTPASRRPATTPSNVRTVDTGESPLGTAQLKPTSLRGSAQPTELGGVLRPSARPRASSPPPPRPRASSPAPASRARSPVPTRK